MKRLFNILVLAMIASEAAAQTPSPFPPPAPGSKAFGRPAQPQEASLTRFDLDFPGGTPSDLIVHMEKAMGKAVNAIVPGEASQIRIPPLKLRSVTVPELFDALGESSQRTVSYVTGFSDFGNGQRREVVQQAQVNYGFNRTGGAPLTDETVWYFYDRTKQNLPSSNTNPKICRFWQLGPYLEAYKIDDITTAIQTGYRLLGETAPVINFHKDTRLLIAVGESANLKLIDDVLRELTPGAPKSVAPSAPLKPAKSAERSLQPER